jgi:hypothetical protein
MSPAVRYRNPTVSLGCRAQRQPCLARRHRSKQGCQAMPIQPPPASSTPWIHRAGHTTRRGGRASRRQLRLVPHVYLPGLRPSRSRRARSSCEASGVQLALAPARTSGLELARRSARRRTTDDIAGRARTRSCPSTLRAAHARSAQMARAGIAAYATVPRYLPSDQDRTRIRRSGPVRRFPMKSVMGGRNAGPRRRGDPSG